MPRTRVPSAVPSAREQQPARLEQPAKGTAAFVRKLGGGAITVSGTTVVVTPVANAGAGNLLVMATASGGNQSRSVADTKGNTWTAAADNNGASSRLVLFWTVQNGGALTTGDTITVTYGASLANATVIVDEFSGMQSANPVDASGVNTSSTTTAMTVTSNALTNGNDLVIAAFAWQGTTSLTCTPVAPYVGDEQDQGGGGFLNIYLEYQILAGASLTTQTAAGTLSGAPLNATQVINTFVPLGVFAGGTLYPISLTDTGVTQSDALVTGRQRTFTDTGLTETDTVATGRLHNLTDTGLTETDTLVTAHAFPRAVADTGIAQSDALISGRLHTLADTGIAQSDTLAPLTSRARVLSDDGLTQLDLPTSATLQTTATLQTSAGANVDTLVTTRLHALADTGLAQSDSIQLAGSGHFTRNLTDTGLTETDTLVTLRARVVTDTGLAQTDTTVSGRLRSLTDTGLAQSDSITRTHLFARSLTDTGITETDLVVSGRLRALADTGLTQSDSITIGGSHHFNINLADTGVVESDTIRELVARTVTDTGLAQSDALVKSKVLPRSLIDTGLAQSDAPLTLRQRTLTDQAVTFNDVIIAITTGTTIITASFNTRARGQVASSARELAYTGAGHGQPGNNPSEGRFN